MPIIAKVGNITHAEAKCEIKDKNGNLVWRYVDIPMPKPEDSVTAKAMFKLKIDCEKLRSQVCKIGRRVEVPEHYKTGERQPTTVRECINRMAEYRDFIRRYGNGANTKSD